MSNEQNVQTNEDILKNIITRQQNRICELEMKVADLSNQNAKLQKQIKKR